MTMYEEVTRKTILKSVTLGTFLVVLVVTVGLGCLFGCPSYNRYQTKQDNDLTRAQHKLNAENQTQINAIIIQQTQQLVEVEKQKAQVREQEAIGIAGAQKTINATLTDRYLQHEAINAQEKMANSPNHTTIYIPAGNNGIPLVHMTNEQANTEVSK